MASVYTTSIYYYSMVRWPDFMRLGSCDDLNKVTKFGNVGLQLTFVKSYIVVKIAMCVVLRLNDHRGCSSQRQHLMSLIHS